MKLSFWRYSHFILASTSFVFLILLTITGAILSLDAIINAKHHSNNKEFQERNIISVIQTLKEHGNEVFEFKKEPSGAWVVDLITEEGEAYKGELDAKTLSFAKPYKKQGEFISFITKLHRSLFLKKTGRYIVAIVSGCLFLITISGMFLVIKRQGGIRQSFAKVVDVVNYRKNHVFYGRIFLIPISIIAVTGLLLSSYKLNWISKSPSRIQREANGDIKQLTFSDVQKIICPFSDAKDDYYEIETPFQKLYINQYNWEIAQKRQKTIHYFIEQKSFVLHTGVSSGLWAMILFIACCYTFYFIYSGFRITLDRTKSKVKTTGNPQSATTVILVGSETGGTFRFANHIKTQLEEGGEVVCLDTLNAYRNQYKQINTLLVLTSTYGDGEAPTNAKRFLNLFAKDSIKKPLKFAVLGFGSKAYPKYCAFAQDIAQELGSQNNYSKIIDTTFINNQSQQIFNDWGRKLFKSYHLPYTDFQKSISKKELSQFSLLTKTKATSKTDDIFRVEFAKNRIKIKNGDWVGVQIPNESERLYSVGKSKSGGLLLAVKRHPYGKASNLLHELNVQIALRIIKNPHFHIPKKKPLICIANGTGIAPFLNMELNKSQEVYVYWGVRKKETAILFEKDIRCSDFKIAYSQEQEVEKRYVQDLLLRDAEKVKGLIKNGAHIRICGSINMYNATLQKLDVMLNQTNIHLPQIIESGRLQSDCY